MNCKSCKIAFLNVILDYQPFWGLVILLSITVSRNEFIVTIYMHFSLILLQLNHTPYYISFFF